jgi:hypothetical protein
MLRVRDARECWGKYLVAARTWIQVRRQLYIAPIFRCIEESALHLRGNEAELSPRIPQ